MFLHDLFDVVEGGAGSFEVSGFVGRADDHLAAHHVDVLAVPVDLVDGFRDGPEKLLRLLRHVRVVGAGVDAFPLHVGGRAGV